VPIHSRVLRPYKNRSVNGAFLFITGINRGLKPGVIGVVLARDAIPVIQIRSGGVLHALVRIYLVQERMKHYFKKVISNVPVPPSP
jgi:hypothetical protein